MLTTHVVPGSISVGREDVFHTARNVTDTHNVWTAVMKTGRLTAHVCIVTDQFFRGAAKGVKKQHYQILPINVEINMRKKTFGVGSILNASPT